MNKTPSAAQPFPLLATRGLRKRYQKAGAAPVEVLRGVDLTIRSGDQIAILGKSGAGKSTLLHILGGLESPSEGSVQFMGQDVFRFSERELSAFRNSQLGFVFQFHYLMLEFTALENVMMPALLAKRPKKEAEARSRALLAKVGLKARVDHRPSQLSGGEQQRVAIARALIMNPKVLLTDEMTGNLDPQTGRQIFDLVQDIQYETGVALVSVTHDEVLADSYPKSYRLSGGELTQ